MFIFFITNSAMNKQFQTVFKKKAHRERYYSSMNYDEYCDIYGPPPLLFKPQQDPFDDLPLFDLQAPVTIESTIEKEPHELQNLLPFRMDTILEIDGSENFTLNLQRSPRQLNISNNKSHLESILQRERQQQQPRRVRVRMRYQSDNSQYLIFNFLQRVNEKGRKKIKFDP